MRIVIGITNDWCAVDAAVIETLIRRGFTVAIINGRFRRRWEVTVPEWRDYLSAVWHVYADISRGSDGVWPLHCRRIVAVHVGDLQYSVRYWVSSQGIQYGSVSE